MADIAETKSFGDALRSLKQQGETTTTSDPVTQLEPSKIHTNASVFQPRVFGTVDGIDERHVKELAKALRTKPATQMYLDPVLVTDIGGAWYCVDGHHRLAAYRTVGIQTPIPVEVISGPLREVLTEAIHRNSKDRLAMTQADKMEAAWRLVLLDAGSKREISDASGVSERTIANMRVAIREIETSGDDPTQISWLEAKRVLSGKDATEYDEDWEEALASDWAKLLGKTFGRTLVKQPRAVALAIELYSEKLPTQLLEEWTEIAVDHLRKAGYAVKEPDDEF